jgi:hypothetical protein
VVFWYGRDEICPTSQRKRRREAIDACDDLAFPGSLQESVVDYAKVHAVAPSDDMIPLGIELNSHGQQPQRMIAAHHADIAI